MRKLLTLLVLFLGPPALAQISTIDSLMLNGEYEVAMRWIESHLSKAKVEDQILIENKKAQILIQTEKLTDAEKIINDLLQRSKSDFEKAITFSNNGLSFIHQGRYDKALETLQIAIQHFEKDGALNSLEAAQALTYLGLVYQYTGKHTQAQEQMQRALDLRLNKLKPDHELIAASYNDLGLCYVRIDNDKALDYYEKALKIYEKLHGKDHSKIAIASINTGFVYNELELYGDAVNNFETSLRIWEKIHPEPHQTKAFALLNLGNTYFRMGDHKAAKAFYEKSLSMYRQAYGSKHPEIAGVLNALANVELAAEEYDEALSHFQEALTENVTGFDNNNIERNPTLKNYYHGNTLLYSLMYKAEAFEKRYAGKTLRHKDLIASLTTLQYCDSLIDQLRQQSSNENDKIALGIIANDVYADGVRVAYELVQNSIKKDKYLDLAFYFAEKSKSAVLLEAISESNAKSFAGIPGDLLEEERTLKSSISLTAQKLSQKPGAEEEKYLRETSFNLNRSYERFVKKIEQEFPQYFNLKFSAASPSILEIQKLIDNKTAMLSYFVDEKGEQIYIFMLTKDKFRITDHRLPKDFTKLTTGFRNSLFYNEINTYRKTARQLSELLLPSIPRSITDLIILPTGKLSIIPFEALVTNKTKEEHGFDDFHYLINDYNVRYEFSASLLLQKSKRVNKATLQSIFLCAPVSFPEKENLSQLPGTEAEVTEISKLFAGKSLTASVNLRDQANESLIKQGLVNNYSILHFATHGIVDESQPELSRIFLQPSADKEDGKLFSGEIYNLNLNANLVTLSACQTGLGKISKGEGVIGLSRALVYAGAKNIIVSFWSVADHSTAELMTNFYKQVLDQPSADYSESLRKAKLNLITTETFSSPYYWAPFILIGF